ncbi:BolA/IbaG family iron-sulfur metabolism protein [Flagellatimonas centrodinii]|uniref:BolA family protein n=1 Tax=Flagellatimonas centrodinii TaxID=2806210 RepID=UPI001FEEBE58|nr:BolA/IbaG family iron-sulfur metabolism protein [Flagellatimonas centrodinii]ULQ47290.1 BolA/IbaG family iron-sulfur metabolism protein [Flagellatimonas centrodinii]
MMDRKQIEQLIEAGLPGCVAMVKGDDGQHFEAEVLYPGFAGKTMIEQHRMVYAALGERMGREIHALALRTRAPKAPCA